MIPLLLSILTVISLSANNSQDIPSLCEMDREEAQKILDYETAREDIYDIRIEEYCDL